MILWKSSTQNTNFMVKEVISKNYEQDVSNFDEKELKFKVAPFRIMKKKCEIWTSPYPRNINLKNVE